MPGVRQRGEEIREFILLNITENKNIAALTSERFGITLPAVYKHIDKLISDKQIVKRDGRFVLQSKLFKYVYEIDKTISEDAVWEKYIKKHFSDVPENIYRIWIYGFLEMFNNALEHSKGKTIHVILSINKINISASIYDDGIGIFRNIKSKYKLIDEKDALLELVKGKRTTDKTRHSGQGIFFTSKMFDDFLISSNGIIFNVKPEKNIDTQAGKVKHSTLIFMRIANNSKTTSKGIFDEFSTESPGDFDKTNVPIRLANSTDLVSRSQARRVLSGLELFKEVILDFRDIEYIGQAFADEIFRVFPNLNPGTLIIEVNTNTDVQNMINRARNTKL